MRDFVEDFKTIAPTVFKGDEVEAKKAAKTTTMGQTIGGGAAGEDAMQSMVDTIRAGVTARRQGM